MCSSCKKPLKKKLQPLDALANFQYYARDELPEDVKEAFAKASLYELMMVSRSRATRITHMFCEKKDARGHEKIYETSQGFSQGNVAILAQDVPTVQIKEAMTVPTRDNIKELKPVLVSKNRVETMVKFLLSKNAHYVATGIAFKSVPEAFPQAVEICCLSDKSDPVAESYADRGDQPAKEHRLDTIEDDGSIVVDAVGYIVGVNTPNDQRNMKASAVAWCLDKKNCIKMQSSSEFITDRDPGLLTFTFSGLDPWGIGGFHEPNRTEKKSITTLLSALMSRNMPLSCTTLKKWDRF
ncbi:hypothetical protein C8R43DRAFT_1087883 [Mycena crocata]|nr:hypothetical protein C8R43DRAFT_1087883 [Mycena crocata]